MSDPFIIGVAVAVSVFACLYAERFFKWWFARITRKEHERWLRSHTIEAAWLERQLEEITRG